jgi:GNAT superfamily N-acetyltransferase
MKSFKIGHLDVGQDAPVFVIAELSANHGQRKDIALATIEAAARAGANAIKLQTYTPDTLTLASSAPHFVVKTNNVWAGRTLHDLYREAMTPWEWHAELKECAESLGLLLFSTPFDPTAVEFLEGLDVPAHKVASFELNDLPLVERMARTGKPLIMSTGMASLGDIEAAIAVCRGAGNEQIALLRCVSCYPAKPESMGLSSFGVLAGFGTVVGLSDHTRDATVAIASVALGAKLIEKHFIVDRSVGGPDSFFSLEPSEFRAMVGAVRDAEKALGKPRFGPSPDELASTAFRRSLFVARDVPAGSVLTCDDVRSVRPSAGLSPRYMPAILGRVATVALTAATPLAWDMVGAAPAPRVTLRAANGDDSERLLGWRNDPETRAMSLTNEVIGLDQHAAWLDRSLLSEARRLTIAEAAGAPVGTVRLDRHSHGEWEVSLTVAPEARGQGYAPDLLRAAEALARGVGAVRLVAVIKAENEASVRAFKRAGYYGFAALAKSPGVLACERRIVDYA